MILEGVFFLYKKKIKKEKGLFALFLYKKKVKKETKRITFLYKKSEKREEFAPRHSRTMPVAKNFVAGMVREWHGTVFFFFEGGV